MGKVYFIENQGHAYQVLNVNEDGDVSLRAKEDNIWENWYFTADGSETTIKSQAKDLYLDAGTDGDVSATAPNSGSQNPYQVWKVQDSPSGSGKLIVQVESGLFLDANDGEDLKVRAYNDENPYMLWNLSTA